MKRALLKQLPVLFILLLVLYAASAAAEVTVSFAPEAPRAGDYVDVTVSGTREGTPSVIYKLSTAEEVVCESDPCEHLTASFRPREEKEYTLTVTLVYGKKDQESATVTIPVSGTAPVQEGPEVVYSQKDGWWRRVMYNKKKNETLQKGGCAIFSLSHILQRYGVTGEEVLPASLAAKNARFYVKGGTDNEGLISQAARDYGFVTQADVIRSEREAVYSLRRGDLFTFGITLGHIAMVDGVSEDGSLVHVVDSAPGATFERKSQKRLKSQGHVYYLEEDGSFTEAETPDQLPGIRWFFETGEYGGMSYWLDLHYSLTYNKYAGMRLIRRPWLYADTGSGLQPVTIEYAGALVSRVKPGEGEAVRIPTKDLQWTTDGADSPQVAMVSNKKGAHLVDGDGKNLERYSRVLKPGTMMAVLCVEDDLCYVWWKDTFCYVARKDVDLLSVQQGAITTGLVSMNGKTAGTATVIVRSGPKGKSSEVTQWTIGTPVAVVASDGDYYLAEGKGCRGWIQKKYFTPDNTAAAPEE